MKRSSRVLSFLLPLCTSVVVFLGASPAHGNQTAINTGKAWLLSVKGSDGSWRSLRDPRGVRSTARVMRALREEVPPDTTLWLTSQGPKNLEEANDGISAVRTGAPESFFMAVTDQKIADGRWGSAPSTPPSAYHTALALIALSEGGQAIDAPSAAITYLQGLQFSDGSWPVGEKGQETLVVTATVAQALSLTRDSSATPQITKAKQWLLDQQHADGGWGPADASLPGVTAEVLISLRKLGCSPAVEAKAVTFLLGTQDGSGSWEEDPWTTASVLLALLPAGLPDVTFVAGSVIPDPNPVPGDIWQISGTISNLGTETAQPVVARVSLRSDTGVEIGTPQEWSIDSLAPGGQATVTFRLSMANLSGAISWHLEIDPDNRVVEGDEGNNVATGTISVGGWRNLAIDNNGTGIYTADGLLALDAGNLAIGTDVLIKAKVRCDGTAGSGPVQFMVFRGEPAEGAIVDEVSLAAFAAGEERVITISWTVASPTGEGFLSLNVDPRAILTQTQRTDDRVDLPIIVRSEDSERPAPPTGLMVRIDSKDKVVLTWQHSPSTDVVGYRVFRDGVPVNTIDLAQQSSASASDSFSLKDYLPPGMMEIAAFDPPNLNDGNPDTSWWSIQDPVMDWEREPCFVQFALPATKSVRGVIIKWYNFDWGAADYRVQTWNGIDWIDATVTRGNILDRSVEIFSAPVMTEKVRVLFSKGITSSFIAIREVSILEGGPGMVVTGTTFDDTSLDALPADYHVTAVDAAGNESVPSSAFHLQDGTPPEVAISSPSNGQRIGPEVVVRGTAKDDFLQGDHLDWESAQIQPNGTGLLNGPNRSKTIGLAPGILPPMRMAHIRFG